MVIGDARVGDSVIDTSKGENTVVAAEQRGVGGDTTIIFIARGSFKRN